MTVLLLAGSGEARQIAQGLADKGIKAIASLAGATRAPDPLPIETRTGGFGGADGFGSYLSMAGIKTVIDATHPYADRITQRTAAICTARNLPYIHVMRAPWTPEEGDNWTEIDREEEAANYIKIGQTVFLGTGRQTLDRFANLEGCRVICRQIDPPTAPFPFAGGEFLIGRPPFPVAREEMLFAALGIDWLVVKNAGGDASRTKLTAARTLKIPVLMLRRPEPPVAERAETAEAALRWLAARL